MDKGKYVNALITVYKKILKLVLQFKTHFKNSSFILSTKKGNDIIIHENSIYKSI